MELSGNDGSRENRVTWEHEDIRPPAATAQALMTWQLTSPPDAAARKQGNGRLRGLLG